MNSVGASTFVLAIGSEPAQPGDRDTLGGWPILEAGRSWPECDCGARLALFFQLEIPAEVPHFGGDQLLVFHCPQESGPSGSSTETQLPERYWDHPPGADSRFWQILLQRNGTATQTPDPYFPPKRLIIDSTPNQLDCDAFGDLGGIPDWLQAPEHHHCACGTDLAFLCQIYEDFPFADYVDPDLDDSLDSSGLEDGLFLGNQVYLFACPAHCDPAATWAVCQN
ncbi:hypothetical protein [Nocardia sp. NPDC048505]|uniref:hypothetical protein n=1 Tax=unclassified Nocardia TaxID=2637762 RepID=UPI0033C3623F